MNAVLSLYPVAPIMSRRVKEGKLGPCSRRVRVWKNLAALEDDGRSFSGRCVGDLGSNSEK